MGQAKKAPTEHSGVGKYIVKEATQTEKFERGYISHISIPILGPKEAFVYILKFQQMAGTETELFHSEDQHSFCGSDTKDSACNAGDPALIPGEGNGYSSILAWRSPWTEEPGRLQSIGLQRVGHDWRDLVWHMAHKYPWMQLLYMDDLNNPHNHLMRSCHGDNMVLLSFSLEAMAQNKAKARGGKGTSLNSGEGCTQGITTIGQQCSESKVHRSQDNHTSSYHQVKTLLSPIPTPTKEAGK